MKDQCEACGGSGTIVCAECQGFTADADYWSNQGFYDTSTPQIPYCRACSGQGKSQCPSCEGTGKLNPRGCESDRKALNETNQGGQTQACTACYGTGRGTDACEACGGWGGFTGNIAYSGDYTAHEVRTIHCDACNDTGKAKCGNCGGTGHLSSMR